MATSSKGSTKGSTLTPLTRKEKIQSGIDIDPVTRDEYFLKKQMEAAVDLPAGGEEGQVLVKDEDGSNMWADIPSQFPSTSGMAGKVLTVDERSEDPYWGDVPTELPERNDDARLKYLRCNWDKTLGWAGVVLRVNVYNNTQTMSMSADEIFTAIKSTNAPYSEGTAILRTENTVIGSNHGVSRFAYLYYIGSSTTTDENVARFIQFDYDGTDVLVHIYETTGSTGSFTKTTKTISTSA